MTYEITYQLHDVYQALLVRAASADQAASCFASHKPAARLIDVSVAASDSYKPGMPVLLAGPQ